jgi:hypothetical protein
MALDELHARRLATVASIIEDALGRVEVVLQSLEGGTATSPIKSEQIQKAREEMAQMRRRLHAALGRFSVRLSKPDPRQILAAELSTLWVVLENAMPERLKGYGKEFTPADRKSWEELMRALLEDLEQLRECTRNGRD